VNRFFMLGLKHRWRVLFSLLALSLLFAGGLPRLHIDTGINSMIADSDPNRLMYEAVTEEFGSDNQTLIFVRDASLWTPAKLKVLQDLHFRLTALDAVQSVEDIFTLRGIRGQPNGGHSGSIRSGVFIGDVPDSQEQINHLRDDVLYNPLINGNLVSSNGQALALMVSIRPDAMKQLGDKKVYHLLQQEIDRVAPHFTRIFQIGSPRIQSEMESALFSDMRTLMPLSAIVLLVMILIFLRSFMAALIPLITAGLSLIWTLGMMGWAGIPLNILSAMLPTLIIVIGSTEDTHMLASFLGETARHPDRDREFHIRRMLRKLGIPLVLTILTTALGFASNIFSSIDLIRDFALASTFAMLANGVITILLVPILLGIMGSGKTHGRKSLEPGWLARLVLELNERSHMSLQHMVLVGTAVLCVFFLYESSKLYVTNDPMSYFKQDRPLIQDAAEVHRYLAGIKVFFITLQSNREQAFLRPRNLRKLSKIEDFIAKQGVFDRTISLADYLKLLNREFHSGKQSWYQLPSNKGLIAQYLLFLNRQDLHRYVSHDFRRATIVVRYNISDSNILNRHIAELRNVVQDIAGSGMQTFVVGRNLMVNESAETLLLAQVKSLGLLLLIIFLLMSAMFTSFKGGLIAMVPSIIPIILMFGVMGVLNIPLNPGTAMVAVIAIGIAIDGTIHLLSRYNELSRRQGDAVRAARQTVREEALPMVATSLALALGFGVLLFSDFAIVGQFGALSAATMLFALFANLIVTPLIMSRVRLVGLYDIVALPMDKEKLGACRLFAGMSNYQIRKAMLISEMHEFCKGAKVIEQGNTDRSMYLIIKGEMEVVHHHDMESHVLATLKPGDVFGEIAFVREIKRTADVVARNAVTVLKFDFERLEHDLQYFPRIVAKLNFNISYILGERLAERIQND